VVEILRRELFHRNPEVLVMAYEASSNARTRATSARQAPLCATPLKPRTDRTSAKNNIPARSQGPTQSRRPYAREEDPPRQVVFTSYGQSAPAALGDRIEASEGDARRASSKARVPAPTPVTASLTILNCLPDSRVRDSRSVIPWAASKCAARSTRRLAMRPIIGAVSNVRQTDQRRCWRCEKGDRGRKAVGSCMYCDNKCPDMDDSVFATQRSESLRGDTKS